MKKPKGKTPSLIGSTYGTPRRVPVLRKCDCKRCGGAILSGSMCVAIPKLGPHSNPKRFCESCYANILEQTEKDLYKLKEL